MNSQIKPTPYVNETERELIGDHKGLCVNYRGERDTHMFFPFSPLPCGKEFSKIILICGVPFLRCRFWHDVPCLRRRFGVLYCYCSASSISTNVNNILVLNATNFKKWKEHVIIVLGAWIWTMHQEMVTLQTLLVPSEQRAAMEK
ncbi:hypothetical protein AAG906_000690 [Vitis piasezkii]